MRVRSARPGRASERDERSAPCPAPRAPPGSSGLLRAPPPPPAGLGQQPSRARAWGRPGAPRRALPSRAPRHLCRRRRRRRGRGSSRGSLSLSFSLPLRLGGRLRRPATEAASAPPPKPALGTEHAQCRRPRAAPRRAHSTSPGFRGSSTKRRRPRAGRGPSILGNAQPGPERGGCAGARRKLARTSRERRMEPGSD